MQAIGANGTLHAPHTSKTAHSLEIAAHCLTESFCCAIEVLDEFSPIRFAFVVGSQGHKASNKATVFQFGQKCIINPITHIGSLKARAEGAEMGIAATGNIVHFRNLNAVLSLNCNVCSLWIATIVGLGALAELQAIAKDVFPRNAEVLR